MRGINNRIQPCLRSILVIFYLFVISGNSLGQKTDSDSTHQYTYFKKGSKALLFQINENFTLSDFQGALFSMKCHFSPKAAIRFGVGIGGDYGDTDDFKYFYSSDSSYYDGYEKKYSYKLNFVIQYLKYFTSKKDFFLFLGLGPIIQISESGNEEGFLKGREIRTEELIISDLNFGVRLNFGAEFFVLNNISFLAEYGLSVRYHFHTVFDMRLGTRTMYLIEGYSEAVRFGIVFNF